MDKLFDLYKSNKHGYYFIWGKLVLSPVDEKFYPVEFVYPESVKDLFDMDYYDFIDELVMKYNAHTIWSLANHRYNPFFTFKEDGLRAIEEFLDPRHLMVMLAYEV